MDKGVWWATVHEITNSRARLEWPILSLYFQEWMGFPGIAALKNPPGNEGNSGLIPGSGRLPVEGNGNPLQYSCLGNPTNRGVWRNTVHGIAKSWTWLSAHTHQSYYIPSKERLPLEYFKNGFLKVENFFSYKVLPWPTGGMMLNTGGWQDEQRSRRSNLKQHSGVKAFHPLEALKIIT